jgi:hypothetical protein
VLLCRCSYTCGKARALWRGHVPTVLAGADPPVGAVTGRRHHVAKSVRIRGSHVAHRQRVQHHGCAGAARFLGVVTLTCLLSPPPRSQAMPRPRVLTVDATVSRVLVGLLGGGQFGLYWLWSPVALAARRNAPFRRWHAVHTRVASCIFFVVSRLRVTSPRRLIPRAAFRAGTSSQVSGARRCWAPQRSGKRRGPSARIEIGRSMRLWG